MIDDPRSLSARLIAASPFAMSIAEVRAQTQERRRSLLAPPPTAISKKAEPDFSPAPLPIVDSPHEFAAQFFQHRAATLTDPPKSKSKTKKPRPGRKPVGELPPGADRFTVIDGDGVDKPTEK
jgi:hypothetical protein